MSQKTQSNEPSKAKNNLQYDPIGHCIYCGTTDGRLGREHVMPFGMHGEMVLPKSSCDECSKITGKIENFVLGHMLIKLRIRYGLKSRKKKKNQRPQSFNITVENPFTRTKKSKSVPNEYLPWIAYSLPRYNLPGLLLQISPEDSKKKQTLEWITSKFDMENLLSLGQGNETVGWGGDKINLETFNRFLAKVAHSYLVATLGEDNFKPILNATILGEGPHSNFYVGCDEKEPGSPYLFEIAHGEYEIMHGPFKGKKYIAVRIRLFSFLGTPTYVVAAGERTCDEEWFFKQPGYALPAKVLIKGADGKPAFSCGV